MWGFESPLSHFDSRKITFLLFLSFIILMMFSGCTVETQPGKVWNLRQKMVLLCQNLVGVRYRYGGTDIDGFDCSGLVYYVYDSFGVHIPRTARKQGRMKSRIRLGRAEPGDILVFKLRRGWHSGIYVGNRTFIHAPSKNTRVREESLNGFWRSQLRSVIHVINDR